MRETREWMVSAAVGVLTALAVLCCVLLGALLAVWIGGSA